MEYVTAPDGVDIAYDRSGEGPPIVLVHGTSATSNSWEAVRPMLEDNFTVYVMIRRGRGASGDAETYDIQREFDDIATLVDTIDGPVDVVGHSYGALTSLGASTRAESLRRMVLYEPPLWTEGQDLAPREPVERMHDAVARGDNEIVLEIFFRDVAKDSKRLEYYKTLDNWSARLDVASTIPREIDGTEQYRPTPAEFDEMTVPTLVLLGSETEGHLPSGTRGAHALLPNSELRVLDGLDHSAIYSEPERFVDVITAFLIDDE